MRISVLKHPQKPMKPGPRAEETARSVEEFGKTILFSNHHFAAPNARFRSKFSWKVLLWIVGYAQRPKGDFCRPDLMKRQGFNPPPPGVPGNTRSRSSRHLRPAIQESPIFAAEPGNFVPNISREETVLNLALGRWTVS